MTEVVVTVVSAQRTQERARSAETVTMGTEPAHQSTPARVAHERSDTVGAGSTDPWSDPSDFARWKAIELGESSPAPEQQSTASHELSEPVPADDETWTLPTWVSASRAATAAVIAVLVALCAGGLAWHNAQAAADWKTLAAKATTRVSERSSELAQAEAELVATKSEVSALQSRIEDLAAESAAATDDAVLFEQATRAGEAAIDDIVTCLTAQFDLNALAVEYARRPSAALEDELDVLTEDVLYWCEKAGTSASAFDEAVQLTAQ